jgi:hypothetical protein
MSSAVLRVTLHYVANVEGIQSQEVEFGPCMS